MLGTRITRHTQLTESKATWHVIDAAGKRLGRLASEIAMLLMGKHKPDYSRHTLNGDFVIVVNASLIEVSGNPSALKTIYRHTGYVGNLKKQNMRDALAEKPTRVIERTVKGMLPGNKLGRRMERRLKVYAGPVHPHEAQVNAGNRNTRTLAERPTSVDDSGSLDLPKGNQNQDVAIDGGPKTSPSKRTVAPVGKTSSKETKGASKPLKDSSTAKKKTGESAKGATSNDTGGRRRRTTK